MHFKNDVLTILTFIMTFHKILLLLFYLLQAWSLQIEILKCKLYHFQKQGFQTKEIVLEMPRGNYRFSWTIEFNKLHVEFKTVYKKIFFFNIHSYHINQNLNGTSLFFVTIWLWYTFINLHFFIKDNPYLWFKQILSKEFQLQLSNQ